MKPIPSFVPLLLLCYSQIIPGDKYKILHFDLLVVNEMPGAEGMRNKSGNAKPTGKHNHGDEVSLERFFYSKGQKTHSEFDPKNYQATAEPQAQFNQMVTLDSWSVNIETKPHSYINKLSVILYFTIHHPLFLSYFCLIPGLFRWVDQPHTYPIQPKGIRRARLDIDPAHTKVVIYHGNKACH